MKIFISWSGELSRDIAITLREWIPMIIQVVKPYVSSEDIYKGERWTNDVSEELQSSSFGIICLTPENINAPWVHFEAGALSKSIDSSRVCPLLWDVKNSDLSDPFKQFQATSLRKDDFKKLILSINKLCGEGSLDNPKLDFLFDTVWLKLEAAFEEIREKYIKVAASEESNVNNIAENTTENNTSNILEEILDLTRKQHILLSSQHDKFSTNGGMLIQASLIEDLINSCAEIVKHYNSASTGKVDIKITEIYPLILKMNLNLKTIASHINLTRNLKQELVPESK
jgi:hypothetical protein